MARLYPFQRVGVRKGHFKFKDRFLLADDMGLGKTPQSLWSAKVFWKKWPVVVVCPAYLKWNWKKEINHHTGMTSVILEGRKSGPIPKARFILVNYDILWDWIDEIMAANPAGIMIDEVHYVKNRRAKRTKAVKYLCEGMKRIILISGTPIEQSPTEIWTALNILRPKKFPRFEPFATRYSHRQVTPWGVKYKGAQRTEELNLLLKKTCMIRRRKTEVLKDLPPKRRMILPVQLSPKDMKEYKKAEGELVRWLIATRGKGGSERSNQRKTMMIRLKVLVGRLKAPIVKDWIHDFMEQTNRKLITCAVHRKLIAELEEEFKDICVVVHGGVKNHKRMEAVDKFMKRRRFRLFIGQIKAAGVGLNLQAASAVLFSEFNWNPAEHTQFEDRAHRIGQKNPVDIWYLYAEDTIEQRLVEMIQEKQKIVDAVLDGKESEESLLLMDALEEELIKKGYKNGSSLLGNRKKANPTRKSKRAFVQN